MLVLVLLAVASTSANRIYPTHSRTYAYEHHQRSEQDSTHHQHRRSEQDITDYVRSGLRMRGHCDSRYWMNGACEDRQIRVNWIVLDRGSERTCHYHVKLNNNVDKMYDATCNQQYLRSDFERAPISRHTYGDVYALEPSEFRVAKNFDERVPGDPLYRSASVLSVVSGLLVLAVTVIA